MMKKSLLALAVAALSANAFAVDLTKDTSDAISYASEITLPAVLSDNATTNLDVTVKTGFSSTANVKRYVRFDLTNATFETPVAVTDLTTTATWDNAGTPTLIKLSPVVSVGGTKGDNYVVIEITPDNNLANDALLTLALANIKALGGDASVQYRLYETGVDAASATANTLATKSGKLFGFKSGLTAAVTTKGAGDKIDVTQESKFFDGKTGDTANNIGSLTVAADASVYAADGKPATLPKLFTGGKLEVTGDFSAGVKKADGTIDPAAATLGALTPTFTANKATYDLGTIDLTKQALTFTIDGLTALNTQSFTAQYIPTANTGYNATTINLGVLGNLEKNGSSKEVNLVLNPNSTFSNYVRISNTSGLAGKFFVTVINDNGNTVSLNLNEIANQPAELAARASTTQINIKDIAAAAEAKGLTIAAGTKLRLLVEGEVPSLDVKSYTIATDSTTFSAF